MAQATLKQFKSESGFLTSPESNFGDITATQVTVDNIRINGNTLTATNTNGNINLVTTGTGTVVAGSISSNSVDAFIFTGNLDGDVTGDVKSSTTSAVVLDTSSATAIFTGNVNGNITSNGNSTFLNINVDGGTIDGTSIGASSASSGRFTSLIATSSITGPIGNVSKNTGQFTFVTADNTIQALSTDQSNNISSGSIVSFGGIGIAKNANIGGTLSVVGTASAAEPINNNDLTTKTYVESQDLKTLAIAVAFGL